MRSSTPRGERTERGKRSFDVPGALAITAAMLLLVYTVVSAQQAGWGSARTVGSFAGVGVLLGMFAVIERASRDPLVPFVIFSSGALRRANIGAVTLFGTYISFQFLVTQYLQTLSGWSAMSTALAFLPAGVMVVILSTRMGSLLSRFGPAPLTGLAFTRLAASVPSWRLAASVLSWRLAARQTSSWPTARRCSRPLTSPTAALRPDRLRRPAPSGSPRGPNGEPR